MDARKGARVRRSELRQNSFFVIATKEDNDIVWGICVCSDPKSGGGLTKAEAEELVKTVCKIKPKRRTKR